MADDENLFLFNTKEENDEYIRSLSLTKLDVWRSTNIKISDMKSYNVVIVGDSIITVGGYNPKSGGSLCAGVTKRTKEGQVKLICAHRSKCVGGTSVVVVKEGGNPKIITVGGWNHGEFVDKGVREYSTSGTLRVLKNHKHGATQGSVCSLGETGIVIVGGYGKDNYSSNLVTLYDVKTEESYKLPKMSQERFRCAVVSTQMGEIVVLGGIDIRAKEILSTVEIFNRDTLTWERLPNMRLPRNTPTAVAINLGIDKIKP